MKIVQRYQTLDGQEHKSELLAKTHLDKLYGDIILSLGRALANQNYTFVTDYIDANLDRFVYLKKVKLDMAVQREDDDEDDC